MKRTCFVNVNSFYLMMATFVIYKANYESTEKGSSPTKKKITLDLFCLISFNVKGYKMKK